MSDLETERTKIKFYLLEALSAELDALNRHPVDPYTKFVYDRVREFFWTVRRLAHNARRAYERWRGIDPLASRDELDAGAPAPAEDARLLLDMTNTIESGAKTGIQRVVREIARACAQQGLGVPVTIEDGRLLRYYRVAGQSEEIEPKAGDVFVMLDASWNNMADYPPVMRRVKEKGGTNVVVVYDILPLLHPALFNLKVGADFRQWFEDIVTRCDAAIGISRATAESVVDYLRATGHQATLPIGWWPLGADFAKGAAGAPSVRARQAAEGKPYFLAVGTLEPRKGYPVALAAFERLWAKGNEIVFVIVGRPGWNTGALQQRLRRHPEAGRRLYWFDSAGDADLQLLYAHARGVVNTSVAEGFGLPLVEAAVNGAPVVASDIAVFREVGGAGARYFDLLDPDSLAAAIEAALAEPRVAPKIETLSWRQSAERFVEVIREQEYPLRG
jgi:alpha-1,2-rhamnosyltransferase